jgi:hypothetical protein
MSEDLNLEPKTVQADPTPTPAPAPTPVAPTWIDKLSKVIDFLLGLLTALKSAIDPAVTKFTGQYKLFGSPEGDTNGKDLIASVKAAVPTSATLTAILTIILQVLGVALTVPQISGSFIAVFIIHFVINMIQRYVNGPAA